jgi:hypothetical protein
MKATFYIQYPPKIVSLLSPDKKYVSISFEKITINGGCRSEVLYKNIYFVNLKKTYTYRDILMDDSQGELEMILLY